LLIRALAESPGRRPHRQGRPHDYGPGDACDGRLALRVCPACAVGACRPCPNFRRPPAAVSASEDGSAMEAALADAQTVQGSRGGSAQSAGHSLYLHLTFEVALTVCST
jgi:hypothetical protein